MQLIFLYEEIDNKQIKNLNLMFSSVKCHETVKIGNVAKNDNRRRTGLLI